MIIVTPYIAKPMEAAQVDAARRRLRRRRPTPRAVLLGRLNRIYGVAGAQRRLGRAYGAAFGFITD